MDMMDMPGEDFDRLLDSMPSGARRAVLKTLDDTPAPIAPIASISKATMASKPAKVLSVLGTLAVLYFILMLAILWGIATILKHLSVVAEQITKECLDKLRRDFLN